MDSFTREQLDYLDNLYVRKVDCNDRHEKQERELTEINIQLTKINTLLSMVLKIGAFIAAGTGTLLIGAIGKVIFK